MQIGKRDLLTIGHAKSPIETGRLINLRRDSRLGCPAIAKRSGFSLGPLRSALSRVQRLIVSVIRRTGRERNIFSRTRARINRSDVSQPLPGREIESPALTLSVRTGRTPAVRPFLPGNPQPAKVLNHGVDELRTATLRIQVFVTKNQNSIALGRSLCRDPERPRMPKMEKTGGRRRQATAISTRLTQKIDLSEATAPRLEALAPLQSSAEQSATSTVRSHEQRRVPALRARRSLHL